MIRRKPSSTVIAMIFHFAYVRFLMSLKRHICEIAGFVGTQFAEKYSLGLVVIHLKEIYQNWSWKFLFQAHHVFLKQDFGSEDFAANNARRFLHSMCVSHMVEERSPRWTGFRTHLTIKKLSLASHSMDISAMHSIATLRLKFLATELTNRRSLEDIQAITRDFLSRACRVVSGIVEELVDRVTFQAIADFSTHLAFDFLNACLLIAQSPMTLELI